MLAVLENCTPIWLLVQVKQVGEVLRALGQNPTESEVKKLVQTSCKVQVRIGHQSSNDHPRFYSTQEQCSLLVYVHKYIFKSAAC